MSHRNRYDPPSYLLYHLILPPLRLYLRLRYGFRPAPQACAGMPAPGAGPFVVVGNHASNLDFLFTVAALYPHRINVLVSRYFFGQRRLKWLLETLKCIPRDQFTPDPASIFAMVDVTRRGGCLLLYPEGEVNGTGRFARMPGGIGRLCRLMGAPVFAAVTCGSHLSKPKWSPYERRGKVSCTIRRVADASEVAELSPAALEARIQRALYYDDYAWQKTARVPFRGKAPALGLDNLLYLCPRCGAENTLRSDAHTLRCTACHNAARMDEYGLLRPLHAGDTVFESIPDWVDLQRETLRRQAALPDFCLSAPCALLLHRDEKTLAGTKAGKGVVSLNAQAIIYEGTRDGARVQLRYPLSAFYKLPFNACRNTFDIPAAGTNARVSFQLFKPFCVEQFVLAADVLYDLRHAEDA